MNGTDAPWERVAGETLKQHHAFSHYRDGGFARSLDAAWRDHHRACRGLQPAPKARAPKRWRYWSVRRSWVERAAAWDVEQDRVARQHVSEIQVNARVRHARLADASLRTLSIPPQAALSALRDPEVLPRLVNEARASTRGFVHLLQLVAWCSRSIPSLVATERLCLGLPAHHVDVDVRDGPMVDSVGLRIGRDPEAAELAIRLLHLVAQPR